MKASEVIDRLGDQTGINYRKLDYWTTENLIRFEWNTPLGGGSGSRRLYYEEDLLLIAVIAFAHKCGMTTLECMRIKNNRSLVYDMNMRFMLVNEKSVAFCATPDALAENLSISKFGRVFDLDAIREMVD